MKHKSLWIVIGFIAGALITLAVLQLDRQVHVPKLSSTEIFEVLLPDGTVQHLSYSEIERQKQELQMLKKRLTQLEQEAFHAKTTKESKKALIQNDKETFAQVPSKQEEEDNKKISPKDASAFFSKVFSKPVMEKMAYSQISRKAGELAAGLDLSPEQQQEIEDLLKNQNPRLRELEPTKTSDEEQEDNTPERTLEEGLKDILSQEQYQEYQDYNEKKKALTKASPMEKSLLEISWRLKLNEEQKAQTREILQEQQEKALSLVQARQQDSDLSPIEQIEQYIEKKEALTKETAAKMESVLTEDQINGFLLYQEQSNMETQLLQQLIAEERGASEE